MQKNGKRVLAFFLAALLCACAPAKCLGDIADWLQVTAAAETLSGTCGANGDNVTWTLDTETGTLTISGEGEMAAFWSNSIPWASYITYIKTVSFTDGVTSIGSYSFFKCTELVNVTLPETIISIGGCAFCGCTALQNITLGNQLTTIGYMSFRDCTSLTDVTIPDSLTAIDSNAFYNCTSLTEIVIPDSVKSIGESAFNGCTGLIKVTVGNSVTTIGRSAFYGCTGITNAIIGNSVNVIGYSAFYGCASLERVEIPNSTSVIESSAFDNCTALQTIVIPDSVISVGSRAFFSTAFYNNRENWKYGVLYCGHHLLDAEYSIAADYTVEPGTVCIADSAFDSCSSLTAVTIPDGVKRIGSNAFSDCWNLVDIIIPNSTVEMGHGAFSRTAYAKDASNWTGDVLYIGHHLVDTSYSIAENYTILPGTVCIADSAFRTCESLHSVTIPDSVTSIGEYTFYYCRNLSSVTIPASVTKIGSAAFQSCASSMQFFYQGSLAQWCSIALLDTIGTPYSLFLDNVLLEDAVIPDDVTSIGDNTFAYCTSLAHVTVGNHVTTVGDSAFSSASIESIVLPRSVKRIGNDAFYGCNMLTDVYYTGSEAEWNQIEIGSYNNQLLSAVIHFNYKDGEHDHVPMEPVIENNTVVNCATGGSYDLVTYCDICGEEMARETVTFTSRAHQFGEWKLLDPANERSGKVHTCIVCSYREFVAQGSDTNEDPKPGEVALENIYDGVRIEGSKDAIEPGTTLQTMRVSLSSQKDNYILELFDIKLMKDGVIVQPKEPIVLKVEYPHWCKNPYSLQMWHWENGVYRRMTTWIEGYYICCITDSLSPFAFTEGDEAPEHTPGEPVRENEVPATCTTSGSYDVVTYCSHCDAEFFRETVTTEALGHDFGAWTQSGDNHVRACSRCTETESAAHTWGEAVVTPATCQAEGKTEYTCTVCGEVKTESIEKTDHTPAAAVKENETPATCTEAGKYDEVVYCTECHTELNRKTVDVSALGHSFTHYAYNNDATTEQDGTKTAKCDRCDATDTITAPGTKIVPKIAVKGFTASRTVDYRATVTFTAEVTNAVDGGAVHWFIDGKDVGTGETHTVREAKQTYTVQAKYMKDGKVLAETETETVKVNTSFFAKLKAFFRALFKKLPVLVQEYLGVEIIDRVLP